MQDNNQFVTFKVGSEEYATPILKINEIIRLKGINITEIPNTPSYIIGIINLRGEVIPIVDLRVRFGMDTRDLESDNRILIANFEDKVVGLLVDSVSEVIDVDDTNISQPPDEISDVNNRYITGVAKLNNRIIIILDIELILKEKDRNIINKI